MSEALNKLTKVSRFVGSVTTVLMVALTVAMIVAVVAIIAVALNPDIVNSVIEYAGNTINIDDIDTTAAAAILLATVLVLMPLMIAIMYFVRRMFNNIHENNTPFTDDNAKCLVNIALLTVACTIAAPILDYALQTVIDTASYQAYSFSAFPLLVALLLYFLSLVFKYGAELQKESNETL